MILLLPLYLKGKQFNLNLKHYLILTFQDIYGTTCNIKILTEELFFRKRRNSQKNWDFFDG